MWRKELTFCTQEICRSRWGVANKILATPTHPPVCSKSFSSLRSFHIVGVQMRMFSSLSIVACRIVIHLVSLSVGVYVTPLWSSHSIVKCDFPFGLWPYTQTKRKTKKENKCVGWMSFGRCCACISIYWIYINIGFRLLLYIEKLLMNELKCLYIAKCRLLSLKISFKDLRLIYIYILIFGNASSFFCLVITLLFSRVPTPFPSLYVFSDYQTGNDFSCWVGYK